MIVTPDLSDESLMREAYAVNVRSGSLDRPWVEPDPFEAWWLEARHHDEAEEDNLRLCLGDGGRVVGLSRHFVPLTDNTSMIWAWVDVDPERRCEGHGSALVDDLVDVTRSRRRAQLHIEFPVPATQLEGYPAYEFALKRGFERAYCDVVRHLPLPVPESRLAPLEEAARAAYADRYRLEVFSGGVPDKLLPGLCELVNLLAVDAPSGVVEFEPESYTPQRMREYYDLERRQGRTRLSVLAIERETGVVAAQSEVVVPAPPGRKTIQQGTYVHREHRGHRLGMGVKIANLRELQVRYPEQELVATGNDEVNEHMVAINEALGFEFVELYQDVRRIV